MKTYKIRKQMLAAFFMLGFVVGILYANVISRQYVLTSGIFSEYFLKQYAETELIVEDYIWYVMKVRLLPFLGICMLGCTKWKKLLVSGFMAWTGFSSGVVAVSAVIKLGIKGVLLCLAGIFPQIFCYVLTYVLLLWYLYRYPSVSWNAGKTVVAVFAFLAGILLEAYVNPVVMKWLIQMF